MQLPQITDRAGDLIAGFEPNLFVFGHTKNYPRRCSRENQVTCFKREVPADVGHQELGVIHQRTRVGVPTRFTIDAATVRAPHPPTSRVTWPGSLATRSSHLPTAG